MASPIFHGVASNTLICASVSRPLLISSRAANAFMNASCGRPSLRVSPRNLATASTVYGRPAPPAERVVEYPGAYRMTLLLVLGSIGISSGVIFPSPNALMVAVMVSRKTLAWPWNTPRRSGGRVTRADVAATGAGLVGDLALEACHRVVKLFWSSFPLVKRNSALYPSCESNRQVGQLKNE
jgi:hypothetical protein